MTPEHKALVAKLRAASDDELHRPDGEWMSGAYPTIYDRAAAAIESLSAQPAQPQAGEPVKPGPFNFDRYVNGVLMAEGVTIERQTTLDEAMRAAANIASRGPNDEAPVLVYRPVASPQPANPAQVTELIADLEQAVIDFENASSATYNRSKAELVKAREVLTAAIGAGGQAVAVAVKPLEWEERSGAHYADTAFGEACVDVDSDGFYVIESGRKHSVFASIEAAQAFVQKHHDIWVKDWLDPSALSQPHPADERVVEALRSLLMLTKFELADNVNRQPWARAIEKAESALSAQEGRKNG